MANPDLNAVYVQAAAPWQDNNFRRFLQKYQPELFDAYRDFILIGDYITLGELEAAIWIACTSVEGYIKPKVMKDLVEAIEEVQNLRTIVLN